ncbi:hypothetical protein F4777DRAFT_535353 [Nemania sp. FL0916]|nr:hypothetical protein F4777DRAFT_535353 [Nemania sp. FL0916]
MDILSIDIDVVRILSKLNAYEYIIVGSGFGGGPLAEALARQKKKVLVIERGNVKFSTHVLNTSRPSFSRGTSNSPEGNETVYDAVKAKVRCTEGSDAYVGGPVYCVGGRSNLWGTWAPEISQATLEEYFPRNIVSYLKTEGGYDKAFNFITCNSQIEAKYPQDSGQITSEEIDNMQILLQSAVPDSNFDLMPIAAQFNSSAPYKFPMGAYSSTLALMNRMYSNDQYLTVLLGTEVLSVEYHSTLPPSGIHALRVRNTTDKSVKTLEVGRAKVILSAGTIGTASIALNSGLQNFEPLVGKGIIDHDVCYVRFLNHVDGGRTKKPLNLKSLVKLGGERCLLTVTINANSFLSGSSASLPISQHYYKGDLLDPKVGLQLTDDYDTICILFEFVADLSDDNEVVGLPSVDPVLRITRPPLKPEVQSDMDDVVRRIRDQFIYDGMAGRSPPPTPRTTQLGFGVFSHECGTMRMDGPRKRGVVDTNLNVKGIPNLWVCDLSVMPVSPEANPSLTLTALSLRLADYLMNFRSE